MNENLPPGTTDKHINEAFGEPPDFQDFMQDNYSTLMDGWVKECPKLWEQFQTEVVKPTGRPYEAYEEAPLEVWNQFVAWHDSDDLRVKAMTDWVLQNLPDDPPDYREDR